MSRPDQPNTPAGGASAGSAAKPADLHLDRKHGLTITWGDGTVNHFPLSYLRQRCPCATCRAEREREKPATSARSLTILPANIDRAAEFVNAQVVGNYAIQIEWADGHRTGIYDFHYLRTIAPDRGSEVQE